ncbi:hypothetical protein FNV65_35290 [Streptomyces sp. S1A1-8]|uniref:hypothetical protein n=1 Tax=unclassified Streptomyces TaxID=2593676 RepID=UPI00116283A9|nr:MULTISPECIES: hypothetical protein [unclassified Streptomyces]QDO00777.1 hypothetical protein FNV58_36710 [Streptomyces sp. RLB1-9]QDO22507.1 hypothetical protein FNV65_35290 [Streptomyces sp. S1A1-8]QDO32634.1 hypothetical protein FNV63_35310 [Streptomyces sp. S1A1-3]
MTSTKKPEPSVPAAGTRFDYPPNSRHARCWVCRQPRTPLFQTTTDSHSLDGPAQVCVRCWSKHHQDADDECQHCGKRLDEEAALW